jgi:hypothetical protein
VSQALQVDPFDLFVEDVELLRAMHEVYPHQETFEQMPQQVSFLSNRVKKPVIGMIGWDGSLLMIRKTRQGNFLISSTNEKVLQCFCCFIQSQ